MISLKKRNQGFTIVELLIVIVVIGILALLVITTYSGIQAKARNSKRSSDIATVQTQLEAYFQDGNNGHYPSRKDMNDPSWRSTNMKSLDSVALKDPSNNTCDLTTTTGCLVQNAGAKVYSYDVTNDSGQSCELDDTQCTKYTLTATYEGDVNGATTIAKHNLD